MSLLHAGQSARPGEDVLFQTLDQATNLIDDGKADEAVKLVRILAAQIGPHKLVLKAIAAAEKAAGNLDEALKVYDQSLRLDNTQADIWVLLGLCYLEIGNFRRAEECFKSASYVDERYFDAHLHMARLYTQEARFDEAFASLDSAKALATTAAMRARVAFTRGGAHAENDDYDQALIAAEEARNLDGNKSSYWLFEAKCRRSVADTDGAYALLMRLLEADDRSAATYVLTLKCLRDLGRDDTFRDTVVDALAAYPDNIDLLAIQIAHLAAMGQVEAALSSIKRAVAAHPKQQALHYMLLDKLIKLGRLDDAVKALADARTAIPYMPRRRSVELLAGRLESKLGNHDLGLQLLQPVTQVQDTLGHQARIEAVRTLLRKGDIGQAEELTTAMLRMSERDQLALAYRALIWQELRLPKADWLIDYQAHICSVDIPVPAGYRDISHLNGAITEFIKELHFDVQDPLNPRSKGFGSSARGVFYRTEKALADLKSMILLSVRRFIQDMPDDDMHPIFMRKSAQIRLSDSVAFKLWPGGAMPSHMNHRAWLNFVYYLDVPAVASDVRNTQGSLQFGLAPIEMTQVEAPGRSILASAGRLVIFPGYLWRNVLPIDPNSPSSGDMLALAGSIEPV